MSINDVKECAKSGKNCEGCEQFEQCYDDTNDTKQNFNDWKKARSFKNN